MGEFTDSGLFHVTWGDETVASLSMEFMHEGDPDLELTARWTPPRFEEPEPFTGTDLTPDLIAMLARLNLCSGEKKARHYDHEVKGLTVVKPWIGVESDVPAEATVFLARHGSSRGFVLAEAVNPFLSDIDTYLQFLVANNGLYDVSNIGALPECGCTPEENCFNFKESDHDFVPLDPVYATYVTGKGFGRGTDTSRIPARRRGARDCDS
jgi:hypothetical protein